MCDRDTFVVDTTYLIRATLEASPFTVYSVHVLVTFIKAGDSLENSARVLVLQPLELSSKPEIFLNLLSNDPRRLFLFALLMSSIVSSNPPILCQTLSLAHTTMG